MRATGGDSNSHSQYSIRSARGQRETAEMTTSNVEFVLPKSRHIQPPVSPLFSKSEGSSPGIEGNQKFFRSNQSSENPRYIRGKEDKIVE